MKISSASIPPRLNFLEFLNILQVQIFENLVKYQILDLGKFSKNFKKHFCLESFSVHFKKKLLFTQHKIFNTCKKYFERLKICLSPKSGT